MNFLHLLLSQFGYQLKSVDIYFSLTPTHQFIFEADGFYQFSLWSLFYWVRLEHKG